MPLQNRADPTGRLFANSARGLFTGNRGVIHDPDTRRLTGRGWTTKAWIICDCGFQNRKREVFGRNAQIGRKLTGGAGWTNLFFLDEVTALAAGHRPCFECRREKAKEFADCFGKAFGVARPKVADMDARLHAERWLSAPRFERPAMRAEDAPEGAMFQVSGMFVAKKNKQLIAWDFGGYTLLSVQVTPPPLTPPHKGEGAANVAESPSPLWGGVRGGGNLVGEISLITAPTIIAILAAGYQHVWHPSAAILA